MIENVPHTSPHSFAEQYIAMREKEGRMYSDEEVRRLPEISAGHRHYREWVIRKISAQKLIDYLRNKKRSLHVLEVGCGNGWLSAKLAAIDSARVTGIDINEKELAQAKRIFNAPNLHFVSSDIDGLDEIHQFDIIVFAATIQYFHSVESVLTKSLARLASGGEVHILDTFFYSAHEAPAARQRSAHYFESIGFPAMKDHYFHHPIDALKNYNYTLLYNPHSLLNRWASVKSPFHWIRIRHKPINA